MRSSKHVKKVVEKAKTAVRTAAHADDAPDPREAKKAIVKVIILGVFVVAIIAYLLWDIIVGGPLMRLLTNRDQLVELVKSWGLFAPLIYIVLQIIQIIVAPIPGQVVGSIGGFLFGPWGILWTTIGTLAGCYCVFRLARRFGRPLLEKIFKKSAIAKFDFILNSRSAALVLFLIFILPGFPDDIICYIAGLTNLPITTLMLILVAGRFPVIVVTNFIGDGITTNLPLVIIVAVLALVVIGVAALNREKIITFLKSHSDSPKDDDPKDDPSDTKPAKPAASSDAKPAPVEKPKKDQK